jgi:uracil-DNA glycosylase
MNIELEPSWKHLLREEFEQPYFQDIKSFLVQEIEAKKPIYPHPKNIFAALNACPFSQVKVVILGQDPYHGP